MFFCGTQKKKKLNLKKKKKKNLFRGNILVILKTAHHNRNYFVELYEIG